MYLQWRPPILATMTEYIHLSYDEIYLPLPYDRIHEVTKCIFQYPVIKYIYTMTNT